MTSKRCSRCREEKPLDAFNVMKKSKDGRQNECRQCASERHAERYATLSREEKRAKIDKQIEHRKRNPELYYWTRLKSVYNLTQERFEEILRRQGGGCAICGRKTPGGRSGRWNVDHDHACCPGAGSCGKCIRGLLCVGCNHGLGNFQDDAEALERAAAYLRIEHD